MSQETVFDAEKQQEQEEDSSEESKKTGRYPVLTNNEDQAAWINTDKNQQAYLSVKTAEGEYVNLFPQSDALQITLNQLHEQQKKQDEVSTQ